MAHCDSARPYLIADAHCDTLWAAPRQGRLWTERSTLGHADLPRLREAGVGLQVFALFSDPSHRGRGYAVAAMDMIDRFYTGLSLAQSTSDDKAFIGVILKQNDVPRIRNGFGAVLSIEGGEALGGSIGALRSFFRLGVRMIGLVWNGRNELADGVDVRSSGGGLTPFGKQVVGVMEMLGMIVDVSHLSDAGFWDVLRIARRPIVASHSNVRALCDHPRNVTDDQIRAVASTGGLVGINFHGPFLRTTGRAQMRDVVDHIDYVASLVGIDHVVIGSDYDGIPQTPVGLRDVTQLPNLADALIRRGYASEHVRAVMGENLIRFFTHNLPSV